MPEPMSRERIGVVLEAYRNAARRVREAGFDGVDLDQASLFFTTHALGYLVGSLVGGRLYDRVPGLVGRYAHRGYGRPAVDAGRKPEHTAPGVVMVRKSTLHLLDIDVREAVVVQYLPGRLASCRPLLFLLLPLLLLVLPGAGLLVGLIVTTFAPEAEGHGTDAVINAYHRGGAVIKPRIIPAKLVASALTIGSGGSAGREGPVAQISAGFASYLSQLLRLPTLDRRILVISGMAAGIGGMFRAPLGSALFAIEVLYSENDYESEALIPAIMSSIVAYVVNASLTGWHPIFATASERV